MTLNMTLNTELDALSTQELEQLIEAIGAELAERDTKRAAPPKPLDEEEIVQVLSFELKRHRKRKEEVFNPFA